jgi:formyl-CoA transferase
MSGQKKTGPLAGLRILDFTTFQAGSLGTTLLADLGADVIKVENVGRGDEGRFLYLFGPPENRQSAFFYACNRGKRGIALDLKRPEAIAVVERLAAEVDVVANNFRPGVMERLGLSYERLRRVNPRLVYVSMTGWGKRGPKAGAPALDTAAQARGGLIHQTGEPDGAPVPAGAAVADSAAALNLAIAILAGIVARDRTGIGQEIDVSLYGSVLALQAPEIDYALLSGKEVGRAGRSHPLLPTLTRVFRCGDDRFLAVIGVEDTRWPGFCRAIGRPDLREDPRFVDVRARKRNMPALYEILDRHFLSRPRDEWIAALEAEDQVCAPVQSYSEIASDPVALENRYLIPIDHPRLGRGQVVAFPFEFHGTPARYDSIEPVHGEHTWEVLKSLGLQTEDIERLLREGIAQGPSSLP